MTDCPRCGSDNVKDTHTPSRNVALAPGVTGYQNGDKHEARCLNCGWHSVYTYRKGVGWELTFVDARYKPRG